MTEIAREWRPIEPPFRGTLRVINLLDDLEHDGLVLYLGEVAEANFAIRFGDVLAYRRSSSSAFIRTWRREIPYPFYTVENSLWVSWLHEESYGQYASERITHYVVATLHTLVEVLSICEPSVATVGR